MLSRLRITRIIVARVTADKSRFRIEWTDADGAPGITAGEAPVESSRVLAKLLASLDTGADLIFDDL